MGYYSMMEPCSFKSRLSQEEIEERFKAFLEAREGDRGYLEFYSFRRFPDGTVEVVPEGGDYFAKHYASDALAEFISAVIAPGHHALLEFTGEDGERWGYLITPGRVEEVIYLRCVRRNGRLAPVEEVIEEILKNA